MLALLPVHAPAETSDQQIISTLLQPLVERQLFSGSVVVTRGGTIIAEQHSGLANRELNVPVTGATRFYVASVTKSFTAAAILMLSGTGALSLDDEIGKFLPDFPHPQITIRELLTHSSGFQHPVFYPDYYDLAKRSYTAAEVVNLFKNRELVGTPGAQTRYSDYNYVVLARIIEVVSCISYSDFLQQRFLAPLDLSTAGNHMNWAQLVTNRASGYQPVGMTDFENARFFDYSISTGAGSMYMSAKDLCRWIEALGSNRLPGARALDAMASDPQQNPLFASRNIAGHSAIALAGWDNIGFAADALYFPDTHLAIAVTANLNDSGIARYLSEAIAESILTGHLVEPLHFLERPSNPELVAGKYRLGSDFYVPGLELEIVKSGDQVYERQKDPERLMGLIPMSDGSFMYRSHWSRITFQQEKGKVTSLTFSGFKATKVP